MLLNTSGETVASTYDNHDPLIWDHLSAFNSDNSDEWREYASEFGDEAAADMHRLVRLDTEDRIFNLGRLP